MAEPLFVRESTAEDVRRLRRQAEAYDALLLRRLADRGEPPADFAEAGELPDEETVLIDTALYHAATERTERARGLVRRDRLTVGGRGRGRRAGRDRRPAVAAGHGRCGVRVVAPTRVNEHARRRRRRASSARPMKCVDPGVATPGPASNASKGGIHVLHPEAYHRPGRHHRADGYPRQEDADPAGSSRPCAGCRRGRRRAR